MLTNSIANSGLILGLVALAVIAFVSFFQSDAARASTSWARRKFKPFKVVDNTAPPALRPRYDRTDAADQLRAVMSASFMTKKVMSGWEYKVYRATETEIGERREGHRVFAQTALGEVIVSRDRNAHSAINSKRVDILVIDRSGRPVLALEYQGAGHYQGDAAARDAVKKEALRKAGVAYREVFDHMSGDDIRRLVREELDRQKPAPSAAEDVRNQ